MSLTTDIVVGTGVAVGVGILGYVLLNKVEKVTEGIASLGGDVVDAAQGSAEEATLFGRNTLRGIRNQPPVTKTEKHAYSKEWLNFDWNQYEVEQAQTLTPIPHPVPQPDYVIDATIPRDLIEKESKAFGFGRNINWAFENTPIVGPGYTGAKDLYNAAKDWF